MTQPRLRRGFSLVELVVVLVILVALAGLVIPLIGSQTEDSRNTATNASLTELRNVILGTYRQDMDKRLPRPGYYGVNTKGRTDKPQLRYLFINPGTYTAPGTLETTAPTYDPLYKRGWRGPYFMNSTGRYLVDAARNFTKDYGENDDPAVIDGWGNPIVIVETGTRAELRSAGPDGILQTTDDITLTLWDNV